VKQLAISVIERVDTTIISDVENYHKNGSTNLVSLTLATIKVRSLLEFSTKPTLLRLQCPSVITDQEVV